MLINILENRLGEVIRFFANACCVMLFILWGAFFIEHLSWFTNGQTPPANIWLLQIAHLALLIGLLMALKWELTGSLVVIVSALAFFLPTAGNRFLPLFLITILPTVMFFFTWWLENHRMRKTL